MDGTSNYYGILCDSGHKAALGIQLHMTNVWMESRPTPDEFKEVLRKAREMLAKDELWDNILEEMYQNDREERFYYAARKVRGYRIPCPKCGAENEIVWPRITFAPKDTGRGWDGSYKCDFCGVAMSEYDWKKNFDKATYATVTIRFTLSAAQKSVAMIPQGTRIRTGAGIYFATTEYAQIDIGETSVDVLAKAEEVGAESNDIPPGVIDTLVDAIPFVAGAVNIDTSSGGADVESDDSLTRRIWLSPTTYSCAGPRDAYEFWAMSFRSDIENAIAISPRSQPCTAYIYFMLTGGKMPSEKDISEMETFMMNEARRPMTDLVICKAPEEVEYSIDFTYYIGASSKKNADIVQQNVAQAVQEYQDWQRSIGRDINPMELIYRLRAAGVKRVEMREPAFKVVESGADKEKALVQIPKLSGQPTVVYGGVEDD